MCLSRNSTFVACDFSRQNACTDHERLSPSCPRFPRIISLSWFPSPALADFLLLAEPRTISAVWSAFPASTCLNHSAASATDMVRTHCCRVCTNRSSGATKSQLWPRPDLPCSIRRRPCSPFGTEPPMLSAVRRGVSSLALALTSVLWQRPRSRAAPSLSGESELSQHRRHAPSVDGDSGLLQRPVRDAATLLCSRASDDNRDRPPAPDEKIDCDESGALASRHSGTLTAGLEKC